MFENIHKNTFLVFILIYIKKYNKPYSSVWLERGANNAKVVGSIPTVAIFWKFIFFKLNYYILISINYYNNNIILNFSFGLFFLISISCSKHDLFEKISSEQNFITDINKLYIEIKAYFLDKLARTKSEILLLLYI